MLQRHHMSSLFPVSDMTFRKITTVQGVGGGNESQDSLDTISVYG